MWKEYFKFFVINCCLVFVFSENTLVTLPNGQIRGREAVTYRKTTFYAFQEIPYAAPPLGKLRLKPPAPVEDWDGILETTRNTKICFQEGGPNPLQNEDCLYLNVYTPVIPDSGESLPVLIFIHGGQFLSGDGTYETYGPDFFMDTGRVVVVTLNYRTGPFGFLSTQDDVIPGNYGLKDQQQALQWVNQNIELFGGDPSLVTLVGQSAGSASVSYQVLNKKNKGLFRAVICESGTAITPWSYQRYARDIAYQTAAALDSSFTRSNSSEELLQVLQGVPDRDLQYAAGVLVTIPSRHINTGFKYAPVLESGEDGFFTEFSYETLDKGDIPQIPMIIGINSEEAIPTVEGIGTVFVQMQAYDDDVSLLACDDLHIQNVSLQIEVGNAIKEIYQVDRFQNNLGKAVRLVSDSRYTTNIIKYAQILSNYTDVYFYQFSYDGDLGNINVHIDGAERVAHSEEIQYLWSNVRNNNIESFPAADVLTHRRLMEMWTNFVLYLNPTPEPSELLENLSWPTVSPDNYQYLDIRERLEIKTNPKEDTFKEYDRVYQKYGIRPFDTY